MKKLLILLNLVFIISSCNKCQECYSSVTTWTFDNTWKVIDNTNSKTPAGELCGNKDITYFYDNGKSKDTLYIQNTNVYIVTQVIPRCYDK